MEAATQVFNGLIDLPNKMFNMMNQMITIGFNMFDMGMQIPEKGMDMFIKLQETLMGVMDKSLKIPFQDQFLE